MMRVKVMAVDDLNGSIKSKIFGAICDASEAIDLKIREFQAVMEGKTPEQVERLRKKDLPKKTKL